MIPVKLSIEGIYSYRERAEIDFSRLCDARLFGIFGPVGSGKSTILEAITFALYGETERMHSREGRSYNMMNLKSSRLWIDFEFLAGEDGKDRYRFTVELKRNRRDFKDVGNIKHLGYKWEGGEWMPVPDRNAESIIGISYKNFIKTVIIPQGRFQDFLGMSTTDRTRMLKELFDLQRFDLASSTKKLVDANNGAMENIRGRMGESREVRQEELDELAEQRTLVEQQLNSSIQAQKETESVIQAQKQAKELGLEIEQLKNWIQAQEARKADVDELEKQLKRYSDADGQLRDLMEAEEKLTKELEAATKNLVIVNEKLKQSRPVLESAESHFLATQKALEQRETLEAQVRAMETMQKMRLKENEIKVCVERIAKGKMVVAEQGKWVAETNSKVEIQSQTIEQLKLNAPDLSGLVELLQWQTKMTALDRQLEIFNAGQAEVQKKIAEGENSCKKIAPGGLDSLEKERLELTGQVDLTRTNLDRLRAHKRLVEFAAQLQVGEACPLCGALEHPHPMSESGNEEAFEAETGKLKTLEEEIGSVSERIRQFLSTQERLDDWKKQIQQAQAGAEGIQLQISNLKSLHKWPDKLNWTIEETQTAYNDAKSQDERLKKAKDELDNLRNSLQNQIAEVHKSESLLLKIESEQNSHRASLLTYATQIDSSQYAALSTQPDSYFREEAERGIQKVARIQMEFKEAESRLKMLREQVQGLETDSLLCQQRLDSLSMQTQETAAKLQTRMEGLGFQSREEVEQLLKYRWDVERERLAIDTFRKEMIEKKAALNAKIQALGTQEFDELLYQQLLHQQKEIQAKIALLQQEIGKIDNQLRLLTEQQLRHATLRKELDVLELRHQNLKVFEGLFKADGFVNWVSKVYLKELCHRANHRFQALARNRLSLEINDDNAFMVRDMLNDGQTRSVKTLSGGQTFQAALCLALALADNIHARSKSRHNFFFLDEGFGSLDRDSLQVVFETLKSLQKENRVVGVISHVEEMQQEIDVALQIEVDEERGSLVHAV